MTRAFARGIWLALVAALIAAPLRAQTTPPFHIWTTLAVTGGAATASSDTGAMTALTMGWEITPRMGIEGTGAWLDRHDGAEAFSGALAFQTSLMRPRPLAPFVEGGFGLHRASFDRTRSTIPAFYADRIAAVSVTGSTTSTFTDPAFFIGAGVNAFVSRHIAFRPQVEATIVTRHSQTYVVTSVAIRAAYHFEDHPITPFAAAASFTQDRAQKRTPPRPAPAQGAQPAQPRGPPSPRNRGRRSPRSRHSRRAGLRRRRRLSTQCRGPRNRHGRP